MSTALLRWGIIGTGRFGRIHAKAIQALPGLELVAMSNRSSERLDQAVSDFQVPHSYPDFEQLLVDPNVDAVSITTHWRDHFEITKAALAAGKHVLLEKPMAESAEQCNELVELARQAEGRFMVAHICRFDPRVTLAKAAIDAGRIGRIVSMHAKRNLPTAPGWLRLDKTSPLMGDGIHDTDLMMWFLGQAPTRVFARYVRVNQFTYPDIGWAMLEFGNEAIGVVETNWCLPANTPTVIDAKIEVVGNEGALTIDCSQTGLTILDGNGLKMLDTDYWPEQHGGLVGILRDEIEYFATCIRDGRPPDVISPEEAARAVAVLETAEQSADSGVPLAFEG
ncbi:MAG: Gfo/Idh/MocA family oxidoreductase [Pirellulaceae bacterium]|jgi:UDP-N-acetylglucosamine 3-dehydrogenase|nr:Gfo/Idh/MocA family oxidoreductase [Pirellulaceae bacterium]MDP6723282.1 Gfo/Idh/MocA family oxidoreductase [Pirellulaceae bacterium]